MKCPKCDTDIGSSTLCKECKIVVCSKCGQEHKYYRALYGMSLVVSLLMFPIVIVSALIDLIISGNSITYAFSHKKQKCENCRRVFKIV